MRTVSTWNFRAKSKSKSGGLTFKQTRESDRIGSNRIGSIPGRSRPQLPSQIIYQFVRYDEANKIKPKLSKSKVLVEYNRRSQDRSGSQVCFQIRQFIFKKIELTFFKK